MIPDWINGFWMSPDVTIGPWSVSRYPPSPNQRENANVIRSFFLNEGWTLESICGMLGCMQGESTINPAFIQETHRNRLPYNGTDLNALINFVMMNFYAEYYQDTRRGYAIGLVQWDGYSTRGGVKGQKLVNYCRENNIAWYDGWSQLYRLRGEWQYDVTNHTHTFMYSVNRGGSTWDFQTYPGCTLSPTDCAYIWTTGYERNKGGLGDRGLNAEWWFDFFTNDPTAPAVIPPEDFSQPTEADPEEPPFDPDDPEPVDPPGANYLPDWLMAYFVYKRKRGGKKWLVT